MHYELIMLHNAVPIKRSIDQALSDMRSIAIHSYCTLNWRDGTLGQVNALSDSARQIELCRMFYDAVITALLQIPRGYRALLVAVYFKYADKRLLAKKYGVSVSTVYRKLLRARKAFETALVRMGCTYEWFCQNYGDWNLCAEATESGAKSRGDADST